MSDDASGPILIGSSNGTAKGGSVSSSTPNFNGADAADPSYGSTSIWNLPTKLSTNKLWFDSQSNQELEYEGMGPNGPIYRKVKGDSKAIYKTPEDIYKRIQSLADAAYVHDGKGRVTKEGLAKQAQFLLIQQALASGPWGKVYTSGSFDAATQTALGKALLQYQQSGIAEGFVTWLTQSAQKARTYGDYPGSGSGTQKAPLQVDLADPTTLRTYVQSAAMDALGHGLTDEQVNTFVAKFHNMQQTAAQQNYDGTAQFTSPDMQGQAQAYALSADPEGAADNKEQAYTSALVNLLAGPGVVGRPTQQLPNTI